MASQFDDRGAYLSNDVCTAHHFGRELCVVHDDQRSHELAHSGTLSKLRVAVDYLCKPFKVAFRRKRNDSSHHFDTTREVESESKAKPCAKNELESVHNSLIPYESIIHTLPPAIDIMSPHASSHHSYLSSSVCEHDATYLRAGIRSSNPADCDHTAGPECFDVNLLGHEDNDNISFSQRSELHYEAECCSKMDGSLESTLKKESWQGGSNSIYKSKEMEAKTDAATVKQCTPRWYDFWPSDFTKQSGSSMTLQTKLDVHLSVSSSEMDKTTEDEESYLILDESPGSGDSREEECAGREQLKKNDDTTYETLLNFKNHLSNGEESENRSMQTCCINNKEEDDIWSDEDLISSQVKGFPPPISILANETHPGLPGHVPRTFWRSVKRGGRFVLQEVQACPREFFQATREHGRLRLQLVRPDMDPLSSLIDDSNPQINPDTKELSDIQKHGKRTGLSIPDAIIGHVVETSIQLECDIHGLGRTDQLEEMNFESGMFPCTNHVVESILEQHGTTIENKEDWNSSENDLSNQQSEFCSNINQHRKKKEESQSSCLFDNSLCQFSGKEHASDNISNGDGKNDFGKVQSERDSLYNGKDSKDGIPNQNNDASTKKLETANTYQGYESKYIDYLKTVTASSVDDKQDSKFKVIGINMGNDIVDPLMEKMCINQELCESIPRQNVQVISGKKEVSLHSEEIQESEAYGISLNKMGAPNSIGRPKNDNDQFKPDCCFSPTYGFENSVNNVLSPSQKFFQLPIQPVVR